MNYQTKKRPKTGYFLAVLFILSITTTAAAQKNTFTARLNLRGEHSDNIRLSSNDPRDDYFTVISPSLSYSHSTEKMNLSSKALVDVIQYSEESDEDRENQDYSLNSKFFLTERTQLTGDFQYRDDMTLEGELLEAGEVSSWQNRKQLIAGGGLSWRVSELSELSFNYRYLNKNFERPDSVDYDRHSISLSINRYMNSGRDIFGLSPVYEFGDSDYNRLDSYSLTIEWQHMFSETFFLKVSAGGRYTEEQYDIFIDNTGEKDEITVDSTGWIADLRFQRETESATTSAGYSRNLYTNVGGGQTEVDQFFLNYNKRILRRLRVGLEGRVYFRKRAGNSLDEDQANRSWYNDETFYRVGATLNYRFTEKQSVELGYRYSNSDTTDSNEDPREQNAVWLVIKLMYDKIY